MAAVEQLTMQGFYGIRKLIEANKLRPVISRRRVPVGRFQPTGKSITPFNWHKAEELYDLDHAQQAAMPLLDLCHQFVHSYLFFPALGEHGELEAFLLASDRQKFKALLRVEVAEIIEIFDSVGNDEVRQSSSTRDAKTEIYHVVNR